MVAVFIQWNSYIKIDHINKTIEFKIIFFNVKSSTLSTVFKCPGERLSEMTSADSGGGVSHRSSAIQRSRQREDNSRISNAISEQTSALHVVYNTFPGRNYLQVTAVHLRIVASSVCVQLK